MFPRVRSQMSLIFLILSFFHNIICGENIDSQIALSCLSENTFLKYEYFEINFYFSSRKHKHQLLTPESINSGELDIDLTRRTVVIVHGFVPSTYLDLMYNLRDAFLKWNDVNVIYVDWEKGCTKALRYGQATRNTEFTAKAIKDLFQHFIETWNGTNKSVEYWAPLHFIGLSIGAHVVGQAAELLKEGNQPFVYRVTGLDPAEPCFDAADSPLRLKKSSAHFVDVIHTDGTSTLNSRFGLLEPMGHVDFYVNGGSFQPGCNWLSRKKRDLNILSLVYHLLMEKGSCHHLRSLSLFTQSLEQSILKQCRFWAHPWELSKIYSKLPPDEMTQCNETKCIEMGIDAELYNHSTNIYYVPTTDLPPYCYA